MLRTPGEQILSPSLRDGQRDGPDLQDASIRIIGTDCRVLGGQQLNKRQIRRQRPGALDKACRLVGLLTLGGAKEFQALPLPGDPRAGRRVELS